MKGGVFVLTGVSSKQGIVVMIVNVTDERISLDNDKYVHSLFFLKIFSVLCLFQVGSNAGIVGMTKEHLGLALALNVPVFVVVTKIDMCPANILQG